MTDRRDRLIVFIAAFLVLATGSFWGLPGGKSVTGALVILHGGVPYRDFWSMYAPGQFYAVAALFWLFGHELLVQALAVSLIRAGSTAAWFMLVRRLGATRRAALTLSALFALMVWTTGPELTDYPPALLFLLLALDRAVRYVDEGTRGHLRWCGVWLGCAALFKHDVAAYVAVGITIALFLSWALSRGRRPDAWCPPGRAAANVAAAAVLAAMPLAAWTAWSAGIEAWNDLIVFPATVFSKTRGEPFPHVIPDVEPVLLWLADVGNVRQGLTAARTLAPWAMLNGARVMLLLGVAMLVVAYRRRDTPAVARLALLLGGTPFFWAAAHVQQNTHPYTLAVLSAGIGLVTVQVATARQRAWLRPPLAVVAVIYAGGMLIPSAVAAAGIYYDWPRSRVLDLDGFRGIVVPERQHRFLRPIGEFFRTYTREGEPIYVGLLRHDVIVVNDVFLYTLARRPPCCGYTELHPGVADRRSVQQELIRKLEDRRVRAVALWDFGWPEADLQRRKRRLAAVFEDAGSRLLDQYLQTRFRIVASYGEYRLLWRRDLPFPGELAEPQISSRRRFRRRAPASPARSAGGGCGQPKSTQKIATIHTPGAGVPERCAIRRAQRERAVCGVAGERQPRGRRQHARGARPGEGPGSGAPGRAVCACSAETHLTRTGNHEQRGVPATSGRTSTTPRAASSASPLSMAQPSMRSVRASARVDLPIPSGPLRTITIHARPWRSTFAMAMLVFQLRAFSESWSSPARNAGADGFPRSSW